MQVTGTHISYYYICGRKLWLYSNGIQMEHSSELVAAGKLLHQAAYPKRPGKWRELSAAGIKLDFYEPVLGIVHETKKSKAFCVSHIWQLKFYMSALRRAGFRAELGILEYPLLRRTEEVRLCPADLAELEKAEKEIAEITQRDQVPPIGDTKRCRNCSYADFCNTDE
jgi:CRISPR-associated exonuclease Cas4